MRKTTMMFMVFLLGWLIVLGVCAIAPAAPKSVSPSDFYKDNVVTIICPYGPGGGTDFAARLVATFWPDAVGGDARVRNMPGGGTVIGNNFAWKAKADGLTLEVVPFNNLTGTTLLREPGVEYDIAKFNYIGMFGDEPWTVAVGKNSPYNSLTDLQKVKGAKFGGVSKTGGAALGMALVIHVLELQDATVVSGFKETPEISLSIARGELIGMCFPSGTVKSESDKGYVKPLVNIGFDRTELFSNIPALPEALKLSPENTRLLKVHGAWKTGRVLLAPPGVPEGKVKFLRDCFNKMAKLDGFIQHAKARYQTYDPPATGEHVAKLIGESLAITQEDIAKMNELSKKYSR